MKTKLYLIIVALSMSNSWAQLSVTAISTDFSIDFDTSINGVNEGAYDGTGFDPAPSTGDLDGNAWEIKGFSLGNQDYNTTNTSGDMARGSSTGGVASGGLYAFEVATSDFAFGIQPTGSDFTPGTITLKVTNNTGVTISDAEIAYEIWILNDQERANSLNFSYSTDDLSYTDIAALDYTSPEASDASPWIENDRSTIITGLTLNNGDALYLRWTGSDELGSAARDEFAIDDITVNLSNTLSVDDSNFKQTNIYAMNNSILIDGLEAGTTTLDLYNLLGKLVKTNTFIATGEIQKIELSESLSLGIYIVHLKTKKGILSKKIIKR
ncbi:hypothetical protein FBALC1_08588 [Flavobacteriales bacterium ALC-1]|nr:hypothetical protein FBALC1_08588 [Flavobacteriales bacterium ALC-1]